ncbi:unnamed protein product, partial [Symbiodinium natans]
VTLVQMLKELKDQGRQGAQQWGVAAARSAAALNQLTEILKHIMQATVQIHQHGSTTFLESGDVARYTERSWSRAGSMLAVSQLPDQKREANKQTALPGAIKKRRSK